MAGDWIKIRTDLHEVEEVLVIADALGIEVATVVGHLCRIWSWADANTTTGVGLRITESRIDRILGCDGFADALRSVGWLAGKDGDIDIPNFDRHNGRTAKDRAMGRDRQESVRQQKRKNKADKPKSKQKSRDAIDWSQVPDGFDDQRVRDACDQWAQYRREMRYKPWLPTTWIRQMKKMKTPSRFVSAVDHSMMQQYQGLVEPYSGKVPRTGAEGYDAPEGSGV